MSSQQRQPKWHMLETNIFRGTQNEKDHQFCRNPYERCLFSRLYNDGDMKVGGALALVEPLCNTVAYYFHEKIWTRWTEFKQPLPSIRSNANTSGSSLV